MKGVLKFSRHLLDNLSVGLDTLVKQFIADGVLHKTEEENGQVYMMLDHPDFTEDDKDTEYVLYFGNRYNRSLCKTMPVLLHLDKICMSGRLQPVKYY